MHASCEGATQAAFSFWAVLKRTVATAMIPPVSKAWRVVIAPSWCLVVRGGQASRCRTKCRCPKAPAVGQAATG